MQQVVVEENPENPENPENLENPENPENLENIKEEAHTKNNNIYKYAIR